ncbi:hypothetical protein QBC44DRAFT_322726 [Cladorrhinum sp. PSN332]|nr:hypothetical protein QBC44DRAFT_322726 [Cladorrhinum sp. PSN332]
MAPKMPPRTISPISSTSCGRATPDMGSETASPAFGKVALRQSNSTPLPPSFQLKGSIPSPNKMFMLTDNTFNYALALQNGLLKFILLADANISMGACWLWNCVESIDGWLRFRNAASGTYLGTDDYHARLQASDTAEGLCNRVCVRLDAEGRGFVLLVAWRDSKMCAVVTGGPLSAPGTMCNIELRAKSPMLWGFVEV